MEKFPGMNGPEPIGQKGAKGKMANGNGPFEETFEWGEKQRKLGENGGDSEKDERTQKGGILKGN